MIKFPPVILVGGCDIRIVYPHTFKERTDLFGQYDHSLREIRVVGVDGGGSLCAPFHTMTTFVHELIHAMDFHTGHRIFENNEKALDGHAETWCQILRDTNGLRFLLDE